MTHTIACIRTILSDGSEVFDVRFNETQIPCPTEKDAEALVEGLSALLTKHALDEHRIRWAA